MKGLKKLTWGNRWNVFLFVLQTKILNLTIFRAYQYERYKQVFEVLKMFSKFLQNKYFDLFEATNQLQTTSIKLSDIWNNFIEMENSTVDSENKSTVSEQENQKSNKKFW